MTQTLLSENVVFCLKPIIKGDVERFMIYFRKFEKK